MNAAELRRIALYAADNYQTIDTNPAARLRFAVSNVTDLISDLAERTQERDALCEVIRAALPFAWVSIRRESAGRLLYLEISEENWTNYLANLARVRHLFPEIAEGGLL